MNYKVDVYKLHSRKRDLFFCLLFCLTKFNELNFQRSSDVTMTSPDNFNDYQWCTIGKCATFIVMHPNNYLLTFKDEISEISIRLLVCFVYCFIASVASSVTVCPNSHKLLAISKTSSLLVDHLRRCEGTTYKSTKTFEVLASLIPATCYVTKHLCIG